MRVEFTDRYIAKNCDGDLGTAPWSGEWINRRLYYVCGVRVPKKLALMLATKVEVPEFIRKNREQREPSSV